jgi:hypothetical protein
MKKTAVEWLAEQITTVKWKMSDVTDRNSIIEQAKAMEKEQIIDAYEIGFADAWDDAIYYDEPKYATAEQYYKETYESKTNL